MDNIFVRALLIIVGIVLLIFLFRLFAIIAVGSIIVGIGIFVGLKIKDYFDHKKFDI